MATVETFRRITLATPATTDQEHLHVIVDSNPSIPDRTDAVARGGPSPLPGLSMSAGRLLAAGAEVICMPCNTAHIFLRPLQQQLTVPIVHMLDETAKFVAGRGDRSLGLLATVGTVVTAIYQDAFLQHGLHVVTPDVEVQERVSEAIALIKGGRPSQALAVLLPAAEEFGLGGTRTLILGCTEISLVSSQLASVGPVVDSLQVMVDSTVAYALRRRPLPSMNRLESAASPVAEAAPLTGDG